MFYCIHEFLYDWLKIGDKVQDCLTFGPVANKENSNNDLWQVDVLKKGSKSSWFCVSDLQFACVLVQT